MVSEASEAVLAVLRGCSMQGPASELLRISLLRCSVNRPFGFASHGDDDFSSSVSLFQIPDGLGGLGERIRPVNHRCYLAGFDELFEDDHVLVVLLVNECAQLLAHEPGQHERADLAIGASEPPSSPFASNDDEGPQGSEGAPEA
jgi:hypothetical protein